MPIKQLSSIRRLPRAGIIRLGIRVKTGKKCKCGGKNKSCLSCLGTGFIKRPKETNYFVCPLKVQEVYGPEPKKLKILIPVEDEEIFFKQYYYSYGKGFLLCKGDGEDAVYWDFEKGDYQTRKCPCEKLEQGKCSQTGILQFILPEVEESAGVWQITTHSRNSIIDINSGIDYIRGITGRIAFIPLWLIREEIQTQKMDKTGGAIKGRHWTMKFSLDASLRQLQEAGQVPPDKYFLPQPDESQVAGLLQANEENGDETITNPPEPDFVTTLTLTNGKEKQCNRYEALQYFEKIKKEMSKMDFEMTLDVAGYKKPEQIPDDKLAKAFGELVKQYKLRLETETETKPDSKDDETKEWPAKDKPENGSEGNDDDVELPF